MGKPAFHPSDAWLPIVFPVAVIVCILVLVLVPALVVAERLARDKIARHERVVANDIVLSVNRILDRAADSNRGAGQLARACRRRCAAPRPARR